MQHPAVRGAEVRRHVAALLLLIDDLEGGDFLERRDEVFVEILADFRIVQCVHTERFGVVSGKARVFKMAGDVQHEDELFLLLRLPSGLFWAAYELDGGAMVATGGRFRLLDADNSRRRLARA